MYFVEWLTARTWLTAVFPRLLRDSFSQRPQRRRCYVFDSSRLGMIFARATGWLVATTVERLQFRLVDIRDERGLLLRLRIAYQDLADVQAHALREVAGIETVESASGMSPSGDADSVASIPAHEVGRLPSYLAKSIATLSFPQRNTLWRVLLTMQVCAWKVRQLGVMHNGEVVVPLFLERQPWPEAIQRYAAVHRLTLVPVAPSWQPRAWLKRRLAPELRARLVNLQGRWNANGFAGVLSRRQRLTSASTGILQSRQQRPKVAVEYYGHLNLKRPEQYSDLFFWQQSTIPSSDFLVTFNIRRDPLDERKWTELREQGMDAVALKPEATTLPTHPPFILRPQRLRRKRAQLRSVCPPGTLGAHWLRRQIDDYELQRDYWTAFFSAYGVKLFVSWYKYDAAHCVIADALEQLGGVSAIYQRAYESHPAAETAIAADIVFGFSRSGVEIERLSRSVIPYYVVTGYLGDHRFPLLRAAATAVRQQLERQGAKRVLAYTDENSVDDARWHSGHEFMRESYAFLIEKVLAHPWLGLVIKPKVPSTLRRRLGPVARLLEAAEATGRCLVFEAGTMHGSFPPAIAALSADVMIHGHLCAATAGMEGALAGVPTLLMDREGWSVSPLYRLGIGRVVFLDWPALWATCVEHWMRPQGVPGFGDWSPMLDELDPFRDRRAAERMGTYLGWLLDGFRSGRKREHVLAEAAERYTALWGQDKIACVNVPVRRGTMVNGHATVHRPERVFAGGIQRS